MNPLRTAPRAASFICALLLLLAPALPAQTPSPAIQHIEVTALAPWKNSDKGFSAHNFTVTQQGERYPVAIARPELSTHPTPGAEPTHLLVVLRRSAPGDPKPVPTATLLKQLRPALLYGWQISIMRPDGYATPYLTTAAALQQSLTASRNAAPPAATDLAELQTFPGRRILLLMGSLRQADHAWFQIEHSFLTSAYIVDGGAPVREDSMLQDDDGNPIATFLAHRRLYIRGVAHEKSLRSAIHDAVLDANNFYDLTFTPPSSLIDSATPVTITFHAISAQTLSVDTWFAPAPGSAAPPMALRTHDNLILAQR